MRRLILAGLIAVAGLAACERRAADPMAQNRDVCADNDRESAERVAACSALIDSGELDEAARAEAQAHRGSAYREAGQVTPALRDFEAVLRVNEGNAEALAGRAYILVASGQLDAAEVFVGRLSETGERAADAHFLTGEIAQARGDHASALASYSAAIEADRDMAIAYARRGRAKQAMDMIDEALGDFDAALNRDASLVDARAGRCWLSLQQERDLTRARSDAETAVAAAPNNVEAQLCRGILQLRGEEWTQAKSSFEAALEVEPGNPVGLFGRGVARRRSGDSDGREDMNQARDFDRHIGERFDDWGVRTF
ncbi:MAG: tetratricopeptide repeat protein [Hyphomonadaceae bacterium]|nr:tetratricopeptide repeat protein [Hyphomonadaceae bacterium]